MVCEQVAFRLTFGGAEPADRGGHFARHLKSYLMRSIAEVPTCAFARSSSRRSDSKFCASTLGAMIARQRFERASFRRRNLLCSHSSDQPYEQLPLEQRALTAPAAIFRGVYRRSSRVNR